MMNLTIETAIRVMVHLGASGQDHMVSLQDLHAKLGGSLTYLAKITAALSKSKLVVSRRGAHGGLWLTVPPARISLFDIFKAIQGKKDSFVFSISSASSADKLRKVSSEIDAILVAELKKRTLADLLPADRKKRSN